MSAGRCHICQGEGVRIRERSPSVTSESKRLDMASTLWACSFCGHLFTTLPLDVDDYYAHQYDATLTDSAMDEIVSTKDGSIVFRTDLDYALFRRHLSGHLQPGDSVFEFGCGRGRILSRLHKDGFRNLWAFDLSEKYREAAAASAGADHVAIGQRPAWKGHRVACSFFVLEHDARPLDSLRYLHASLQDGGLLYLMLPDYRTNLADLACADHLNHFTGDWLAWLLPHLGFEVLVQDDESAIGATVLLARKRDRPERKLTPPEDAVIQALEAAQPMVETWERLDALTARLPADRAVFLYGAGFYAALASTALDAHRLAGLFDANPRKQGLTRLGQSVASPESISAERHSQACLLVCVNSAIAPSIRDRYASAFHDVVLL